MKAQHECAFLDVLGPRQIQQTITRSGEMKKHVTGEKALQHLSFFTPVQDQPGPPHGSDYITNGIEERATGRFLSGDCAVVNIICLLSDELFLVERKDITVIPKSASAAVLTDRLT